MKIKFISIVMCLVVFVVNFNEIDAKNYTTYNGVSVININVDETAMTAGKIYDIGFDWKIDTTPALLKKDDKIVIDHNLGELFNVASYDQWSDLDVYKDGIVVGKAKLTSTVFEIIINQAGEDKSIFELGGSVELGLYFSPKSDKADFTPGLSQTITIGDKTQAVTFVIPTSSTNRPVDQDILWKNCSNGVSSNACVIQVNPIATDILYMRDGVDLLGTGYGNWGTNGKNYAFENVIIEDVIPGNGRLTSLKIQGSKPGAFFDENKVRRAASWFDWKDTTDRFTKITASTYASLKTQVTAQPLSYGIVTDTDGNDKFIVNFGKLPGNGIKYSDYYKVNKNDKYYSPLFEPNGIDGNYVSFDIQFSVDYDTPIKKNLTNKATMTYIDSTSTTQVTDRVSNYKISSPNVTVVGGSGTATLVKYEEESFEANPTDSSKWEKVKGANFKLQVKNGTDWEDYTGVGVVSGTTNANGLIEFGPLPTGTYKVVETSTAAGFVSNTEEYYGTANEEGEFSINAGDDEGIAIGVTNEAETYSVTYDSNGGTGSQGDATAYRYNADVSVLGQSNLSKTGYDFAGWNTRADGTGTTYVAGTGTFKITANTTLYAKWKKTTASYKVIHNIQDNENKYKAIETETYTGLVGKSPELKPKEISGYTYKNKKTTYKSSSEKSGLIKIPILVDDSLVINLYYDLNIVIKIGPVKPSISNNDISFDNKNNIKEKIKKSDNGKTKINNFLYEKMYKNIETEDSDKYYIYINSVILSVFAFLIFLVPFLVIAYIIKKIENSYDSLSEL